MYFIGRKAYEKVILWMRVSPKIGFGRQIILAFNLTVLKFNDLLKIDSFFFRFNSTVSECSMSVNFGLKRV